MVHIIIRGIFMKFFCKNVGFIRKLVVIICLSIIILLLIVGRFRTMRIKMVGSYETVQLLGKVDPEVSIRGVST